MKHNNRQQHKEPQPEPDTCHECGELAVGYDEGTPLCATCYRKQPPLSTTKPDMQQAAHKGAELLDKALPGWHSRIHIPTLGMASPCHCILGQLYGNYYIGEKALLREPHEPPEYGFNAPGNRDWYANTRILQNAWVKEINKRLKKASRPTNKTTTNRANP